MRRRLRSAAFASLACLVAPAAAHAALPGVLTQDVQHPFVVRPASIGYTGDGTGIIGGSDGSSARHPGHLRWTTYTHRQGIASGAVWIDDCRPDCADGTFRKVPADVHVFRPRHGRFTRLLLTYTYAGDDVVDRRGIRRYGDFWGYYIISVD
jgi:hypothetical protein